MKLSTISLLLVLCSLNAYSKSIYPEDVLIYSTTAKTLITRVYSQDQSYIWFESCDLVTDKQGAFEGFSAKNCSKISTYEVINSKVYTEALNTYFYKNLKQDIESTKFIYEEGFFVATIIAATLSGGKVFDLKKTVRKQSAGNIIIKAAQATVLIVATGVLAAKSVIIGMESPPSIETNILKYIGENSSIENNLSIHVNSSTPEGIMMLIESNLKATLEEVGIVRTI